MSGPPTPERDAALPRDPWADQARRRAETDRRVRRRRRWVGGVVAVAVAAALAIVGAAAVIDSDPVDEPAASSVATTSTSVATGPPTSVAERGVELADLEEVWLLDRGDGVYEWGLTVRSTAAVDRGPFRIDASLRDDDRTEVGRVAATVTELPAGGAASVGGVVDDLAGEPTRLVVDVEVGAPLGEPALPTDALEIVALSRRPVVDAGDGGGDGEEMITGRIRSTMPGDVVDVRLALLWRDERGDVIAAVFHDVDRVRPGVEARFEIPVDDLPGLEGVPTQVSWSR